MNVIEFGFVFLPFLILLLVIRYHYYCRSLRRRGVRLIQALQMLIKHMQLHRGFSVIFQDSDKEKLSALKHIRESASFDLLNISNLDATFIDQQDWLGVTEHWARLTSVKNRDDVLQIYEQHCKLIAAVLATIRRVSRQYGLYRGLRTGHRSSWYELLELSEKLGQLRALGVILLNVEKQGKNTNIVKVKLPLLSQEIDACISSFVIVEKIGVRNVEQLRGFLGLLEEIQNTKGSISADDFFRRASDILEIVFAGFDDEMQSLLKT